MAGIYPDGGVTAVNAMNSVDVPTVNCATELFYSTNRCSPRFEPAAQNALISEVLNAATALGTPYNCGSLVNLKNTLIAINNWCARPEGVPDSDISNDFLLACLNGVQSRMPLAALLSAAGPCTYPTVATPDLDDLLAGCFDGSAGKTPISALIELIIANLPAVSSGAPRYTTGAEILFPDNDTRDSQPFSIADCDGLYIKNPWKGRFYNLDGVTPGIEWAPFAYNQGDADVSSVYLEDTGSGGGYAIHQFGAMTFERITPNYFMTFGSSRVASQGCSVPDETNVKISRHEVGPGTEEARVWKIHKIV